MNLLTPRSPKKREELVFGSHTFLFHSLGFPHSFCCVKVAQNTDAANTKIQQVTLHRYFLFSQLSICSGSLLWWLGWARQGCHAKGLRGRVRSSGQMESLRSLPMTVTTFKVREFIPWVRSKTERSEEN